MRPRKSFIPVVAAASAVLVALLSPSGAAAASQPDAKAPDAKTAAQAVIVLMRDQHHEVKPGVQAQQRQQVVDNDQLAVVDDLKSHGASKIQQFSTVSAVAAKATPDEVSRLRANPKVADVVPDLTIIAPSASNIATDAQPKISQQVCPSDPSKPLLEPEALDLTHTTQAQQLATGKGVKVAYLADGLDVNNPDFIRPDGSHVFFDYQDFSGDGVNDDSGGGEAFGDASSIAAQGNRTYDLSTELPNSGLPAGCTIRIKGFAPGVSMSGIKVFGEFGATESGFVRGIDWAVNHDKVDILSESFGSNPYPDPSTDPVSLANEAALDAGVTVVASSGDSGIGGTVGSPASDPRFIAAGGTTAYRLSAEAKGYTGWVSNNITALSSGGPTLNNKLVDVVAPGFGGMADCTVDPTRWSECTSLTEPFGGTSESAPFVSGASALVIQAYSDTHHGKHPSPDLVKQLLGGTATDLNTPADEQGAGLINSYAAVQAARSIHTPDGAGQSQGDGLVPSKTQLDLTGKPGSTQHTSVTLTNTSGRSQQVTATSRALGASTFTVNKTEQVTGPANAAKAVQPGGAGEGPVAAPQFTFQVPKNTPFLDASMIWQGARNSGQLELELFDPSGRLVQESYDYGYTLYQHVDVHDPMAGKWTAKILWGNGRGHFQEPTPTPGSYRGPISVRVVGHDWTSAGVNKVTKTIPAGGSSTFALNVPLPSNAGDVPASIQFDSDRGTHLSLPVARRALIPSANNATFATTITGGVGRGAGQALGYYLDVPAGKHSMTIDLTAPDAATNLAYYLVSPDSQILSADTNATESTYGKGGTAQATKTASMTVNQPVAGRWQVLVTLPANVSGKEFSEQVTGKVRYDVATARAVNLPGSPSSKIKSGTSVTASVEVTNTGAAGQYFFLDPRLSKETEVTLVPTAGDLNIDLPEDTADTSTPNWFIAPHTSRFSETVNGTAPVDVDLFPFTGNPEVFKKAGNGAPTVDTVSSANQLATGAWGTDIAEVGPFPANGAPPASATITGAARMLPFDPNVTSQTGDVWAQAVGGATATPAFVVSGVSRNLTFTISPTAPAGTVVHGTVYVDTYNPLAGNGSELIGIPYTYTVS